MKILIVTSIFPPEIGGPATYVKEFASRARDLGHKVKIITLADAEPEKLEGVNIHMVKRRGNKLLRQSTLLKKIITVAKGFDVIYAQNPTAIGLPSVLGGKLLGKKVVVKFVGDTAWEKAFREGKTKKGLEEFLKNPDANRKILHIERSVLKNASKVITPGRFLARLLKDYHNIPKDNIVVIPNAVDVGDMRPPEKRENAIITVARLVPWKGVQDVIGLMQQIHDETGAELWVVGGGPYKGELERLAERRAPGLVRFFGNLPHQETMERIASARALVLNSLYEGMSHVLLESMALGTVIVATDVCGNPELIEDGKNGLLVEPNNKKQLKEAIIRALGEGSKGLADEARGSSAHYSWDRLMNKTLDAISPRRN